MKTIKIIKRDIKFWFQRKTRGWSDDECWNLDYEFIKWINSRFKQYKKDASKVIDLEFYEFKYKNKTYTQIQLIDKIIELSDKLIDDNYWNFDLKNNIPNIISEILDIFKLIYFTMNW